MPDKNSLVNVVDPNTPDANASLSALVALREGAQQRRADRDRMDWEREQHRDELDLKHRELGLSEQEMKYQHGATDRQLAQEDARQQQTLKAQQEATRQFETQRMDANQENQFLDEMNKMVDDYHLEVSRIDQERLTAQKAGEEGVAADLLPKRALLQKQIDEIERRKGYLQSVVALKTRAISQTLPAQDGSGGTNVLSAALSAAHDHEEARASNARSVLGDVMDAAYFGIANQKDPKEDLTHPMAKEFSKAGTPVDLISGVAQKMALRATGNKNNAEASVKEYLKSLQRIADPSNSPEDDKAAAWTAAIYYGKMLELGINEDSIAVMVHGLDSLSEGGVQGVRSFYAQKELEAKDQGKDLGFDKYEEAGEKSFVEMRGLALAGSVVGTLMGKKPSDYSINFAGNETENLKKHTADLVGLIRDMDFSGEDEEKLLAGLSPKFREKVSSYIRTQLSATKQDMDTELRIAGMLDDNKDGPVQPVDYASLEGLLGQDEQRMLEGKKGLADLEAEGARRRVDTTKSIEEQYNKKRAEADAAYQKKRGALKRPRPTPGPREEE